MPAHKASRKRTKKNSLKLSRRKLLKSLTATGLFGATATDPAQIILKAIVGDYFNNQARAAGEPKPRRLLHLLLGGGAPAFYFHSCLKPNGNDAFIANPQVRTKITNVTRDAYDFPQVETSYGTHAITYGGKTIHMPHIFGTDVAKSGGGTRPMENLAHNMLSIRGIQMSSNGHDGTRHILSPVDGWPSISGLAAESSQSHIPYVSIGQDYSYKSPKGVGRVYVGITANDPVNRIFGAFNPQASSSYRNDLSAKQKIDEALNTLATSNGGSESTHNGFEQARKSATELLSQGIGDVLAEYTSRLEVYDDLVDRTLKATVPGLTDRAIMSIDKPFKRPGNWVSMADPDPTKATEATCQLQFQDYFPLGTDFDFTTLVTGEQSRLRFMAREFAMAEVLLKNDYSSFVNLQIAAPSGVMSNSVKRDSFIMNYNETTDETTYTYNDADIISSRLKDFPIDCHTTGLIPNLLFWSSMYRCLGACILEFRDVMMATPYGNGSNLWNETVVALNSEFTRMSGQHGMDHYSNGSAMALWSGVLKMDVVGDIYTEIANVGQRVRYPGTQGSGKEMQNTGNALLEGQRITPPNIGATICHLCRVSEPFSLNRPTLVTVDEETNTSTYSLATGQNFSR